MQHQLQLGFAHLQHTAPVTFEVRSARCHRALLRSACRRLLRLDCTASNSCSRYPHENLCGSSQSHSPFRSFVESASSDLLIDVVAHLRVGGSNSQSQAPTQSA